MFRLTALTIALLFTLPAAAQSLPDWAAPSVPPSASPPAFEETPTEAVPTLPGAPTQVPIDGGLGLLALAGAGYAVRKLKQRQA
ncbi:MAG: hypothetical protein AAGF99_14655 [Bacteroidota bacterium]